MPPRGIQVPSARDPGPGRHWPLPGIEKILPASGAAGSFWEDRGDRRHAGVDLYAPPGSPVVAIEDGKVISAGIFTSPDLTPYWNVTYQVTIGHVSGISCRYAELGDVAVVRDTQVHGGEVIGHVGEVLNLSLIAEGAPPYVRALQDRGHGSMLHFEVFSAPPGWAPEYLGGNWFSRVKPAHLLDPGPLLRDIP